MLSAMAEGIGFTQDNNNNNNNGETDQKYALSIMYHPAIASAHLTVTCQAMVATDIAMLPSNQQ